MGNEGGSVTDGTKGYYAASFEKPASWMSDSAGEYGTGKTLIEALNAWAETNETCTGVYGYITWEPALWEAEDEDSYPLPVCMLTSELRK